MDIVIGLVGRDYAMVAADRAAVRSIVRFQDTEDKIYPVGDSESQTKQVLACAGETSDRNNFCEFIQRNVQYYTLRAGIPLTTKAVANFARNQLAVALRKGPYQINLLIGGYDQGKNPSLYYLDYLGSLHAVDKAAHGYGSYFTLGLLDRHYKKDMTEKEGLELLKQCIAELSQRFLINTPEFLVKVVDKNGIREVQV